MTPTPRSATKVIASNSFWYAFESMFGIVMVFATSIPMARVLGPEKLGYYQFIALLTNIGMLVAIGIPSVTCKYMAEYLMRGETGIARAIFDSTFSLQILAATVITGLSEAAAFYKADPHYRSVTMILVLSMWPAMVNAVPSQANNAAENMRANVASSIIATCINAAGVIASLLLHWDLVGVAISFTASRTAELLFRLPPVWRRVRAWPRGQIPPEVRSAMRSFALYSVGLMLLNVVVWDRSDILLLDFLSNDIKQVAFFSISFNITDKILMVPQVVGHAVGVTMMAEYGLDETRVAHIAKTAAKYMYLFAAPLLVGIALLSGPLVRLMYGPQYIPAIRVLTVAAVLALFKPLLLPAQYFYRTHSRQAPLLVWNAMCGVLNVGIDWALIPSIGALGAGIGNGVAQAVAVLGIWAYAIVRYRLGFDFAAFGKITVALAAMAPPILLMNSWLPPIAALVAGVPTGGIIFLGILRWIDVLEPEDYERLKHINASVPKAFRPVLQGLIGLVVPRMSTPIA